MSDPPQPLDVGIVAQHRDLADPPPTRARRRTRRRYRNHFERHGFEGAADLISNTGVPRPRATTHVHHGTVWLSELYDKHASIDGSPTPTLQNGPGKRLRRFSRGTSLRNNPFGRAISGVTSLSSKANALSSSAPDARRRQRHRARQPSLTRGRDNAENEKGHNGAGVRPRPRRRAALAPVVSIGRDGTENDVSISTHQRRRAARGQGRHGRGERDLHPDGSAVQPGTSAGPSSPRTLRQTRAPAPAQARYPRKTLATISSTGRSRFPKDANDDGKLVAADGDKVLLYLAMRRGGDFLYALDASDPARHLPVAQAGGDAGYASSADLVRSQGGADPLEHPALETTSATRTTGAVMGAGYDPAVEDPNPCCSTATTRPRSAKWRSATAS